MRPLPDRVVRDGSTAGAVVAVLVLLGAPVGLLWSALAPRLRVELTASGPTSGNIEGKAFIGADATFIVVVLLVGVLCGVLAWLLARRSGPATVVALVLGGLLAAKVAAVVGVRPGATHVRELLRDATARGPLELYLRLRAPWEIVFWPVGALAGFLGLALARPDELG